jgi:hypothetical protein
MLVAGIVVGWIVRGDRCAKEKIAVNASWQDQIQSQQSEHGRLAEQNKSLMEQISQYQASQKDHTNRARELSDSLKEAFAKRDELQRQMKDIRGNLEVAIAQRNRLRDSLEKNPPGQAAALKQKDDKIFQLSRELTSWQSRVPPLVQRFQERNSQANELQAELEKAQARLQILEDMIRSDQTRIEPVDADSLPHGGDASNEPNALTSAHDTSALQDQIDESDHGSCLSDAQQIEEDADSGDNDESLVDQNVSFETEAGDSAGNSAGRHPIEEDDAGDSADDSLVDQNASFDARAGESAGDVESPGDLVSDEPARDDAEDVTDESPFNGIFGYDSEISDETVMRNSAPVAYDRDSDDLKMIKGIGPSIEKTLNDLGVYRFHQIAEMTEYEIDRVAQQLRGFRSRIYREDWIGQARDLQYQKNNDRH